MMKEVTRVFTYCTFFIIIGQLFSMLESKMILYFKNLGVKQNDFWSVV